jgi:hypothetical protein
MKYFIVLALSLTSLSSFALETIGATAVSGTATVLTTTGICGDCNIKKEAKQVVEDAQQYQKSGKVSPLLEEKIEAKIEQNNELSEEDALDLVIIEAKSQLEN